MHYCTGDTSKQHHCTLLTKTRCWGLLETPTASTGHWWYVSIYGGPQRCWKSRAYYWDWANLPWDPWRGRWGKHRGEPLPVPYKTLDMLVSFLEAAPHIGRSVHSFFLRCYPSEWHGSDNDFTRADHGVFTQADRIDPALFERLFQRLPQLRSLYARCIVPAAPVRVRLDALEKVRVDSDMHTLETRDTEMLLRCLPRMRDLMLVGDRFGSTEDNWALPQDLGASTFALDSLELSTIPLLPPPLVRLLVDSPTARSLQTLSIASIEPPVLPAVQALIDAAGNNLKHLSYDLYMPSKKRKSTFLLLLHRTNHNTRV